MPSNAATTTTTTPITTEENSTIQTLETLSVQEANMAPEDVISEKEGNDDQEDGSPRWKSLLPHTLQSFYILFVSGMNDANVGIILPSLQTHYGLTHYVISIIFLCTTLGYFIAAFTNGYLIHKTSQAKTAMIGSVSMGVGYIVILFALPFPVMCCFMIFVGFGMALMQSCANVVCGEMPRGTIVLNFLHACYGAGALLAPLLAAAILERGKSWAVTYMVLCGMQWANVLSMLLVFRNLKTRAEREREEQQEQEEELSISSPPSEGRHQAQEEEQQQSYDNGKMLSTVIQSRMAYMGAIFLLVYVGCEVTIGNWGYTFLITVRSSDTVAMAHFMSGYWAGICAGRLFLGYFTLRFGEKRMIYCYVTLIIGMLFIFWFVPVAAASAVSLALMGIALGPIYPSTVALANKAVPPRLYAVTIGFLSAFGSGGSALFPYITGVMIGVKGIRSMVPFCVGMAIAMFVAWLFVPNPAKEKRVKQGQTDEAGSSSSSSSLDANTTSQASANTATISSRYRGSNHNNQ